MYGVKSKVGPVGISCVVVWLVLVYGAIWGQLEKSTPPFSFPPKVIGVLALFINKSERNCLLAITTITTTTTITIITTITTTTIMTTIASITAITTMTTETAN